MNGPTATAICAALIVAGCASSTLPAVDPSPMDYRQIALDHVRDHFPDASKIQHVQIALPRSPAGSGLFEADPGSAAKSSSDYEPSETTIHKRSTSDEIRKPVERFARVAASWRGP
jgi:hypothetical protein